jgi:hypothetical protein
MAVDKNLPRGLGSEILGPKPPALAFNLLESDLPESH